MSPYFDCFKSLQYSEFDWQSMRQTLRNVRSHCLCNASLSRGRDSTYKPMLYESYTVHLNASALLYLPFIVYSLARVHRYKNHKRNSVHSHDI